VEAAAAKTAAAEAAGLARVCCHRDGKCRQCCDQKSNFHDQSPEFAAELDGLV
jgi:hypothetical protein